MLRCRSTPCHSQRHLLVVAVVSWEQIQKHNNFQIPFSGTLPYECPQILEHRQYDAFKADMFSMGVTLFIMFFSGKRVPTAPHLAHHLTFVTSPRLSLSLPRSKANAGGDSRLATVPEKSVQQATATGCHLPRRAAPQPGRGQTGRGARHPSQSIPPPAQRPLECRTFFLANVLITKMFDLQPLKSR